MPLCLYPYKTFPYNSLPLESPSPVGPALCSRPPCIHLTTANHWPALPLVAFSGYTPTTPPRPPLPLAAAQGLRPVFLCSTPLAPLLHLGSYARAANPHAFTRCLSCKKHTVKLSRREDRNQPVVSRCISVRMSVGEVNERRRPAAGSGSAAAQLPAQQLTPGWQALPPLLPQLLLPQGRLGQGAPPPSA